MHPTHPYCKSPKQLQCHSVGSSTSGMHRNGLLGCLVCGPWMLQSNGVMWEQALTPGAAFFTPGAELSRRPTPGNASATRQCSRWPASLKALQMNASD